MKAAVASLSLLALLGAASAGPSKRRHAHLHERDAVTASADMITIVDPAVAAPTQASRVLVYINKDGQPCSTVTKLVALVPPPTQAAVAVGATVTVIGAPAIYASVQVVGPVGAVPTPAAGAQQAAPPSSGSGAGASGGASPAPAPAPAVPSNSTFGNLHGVAYSPYNGDGTCKSAAQVLSDFQSFAGVYSTIRLYGVDCNQVANCVAAAKAVGVKLFLGIFHLTDLASQVSTITSGVSSDWSCVDTVSVGNELINSGQASVEQVLAAIETVRGQLRAVGYTGPVVTVDTFMAALSHPSLCDKSDYCALNMHPFFDGTITAAQAGDFITRQIANVRSKLTDQSKRIVITETGWPWQGSSNRVAVPSLANQKIALDCITGAFAANPADLILFTAYNDPWKKVEQATFNAEPYWGINGANAPSS
ncbi:uncharacterized protein E0L32_002641 [Thyridium curvatum]|uniref:Uncharacterized protein n=1 Tax=Thyridium curvatum TaxID=1093900 RepID=A0A507B745_9PEZI|nr:uncharacterized protein E0L32_002641 [Thyridium curvatum]TPX18132.1 hypothetical protein E0L32_002641 [Thyridium curvatum]